MRLRKLLPWIGGVLGIVGMFAGIAYIRSCSLDNDPGKAEHAWLIGDVVVVDDEQNVSGEDFEEYQHRLVAIDTQTGKRVGKRSFAGSWLDCDVDARRLLCRSETGIVLLDARTLKTVVDVGAAAKNDAPSAKPQRHAIDTNGDALVLLDDGQVVRVDANGFGRIDKRTFDVPNKRSNPTTCERIYDVDYKDEQWRPQERGARSMIAPKDKLEGEYPTFISPDLLGDSRNDTSLGIGFGLVLRHAPKLGARQTQLSLMTDKAIVWTVAIGECQAAWRIADRIVVATENMSKRVVSIDVATGKIVWSVGFD